MAAAHEEEGEPKEKGRRSPERRAEAGANLSGVGLNTAVPAPRGGSKRLGSLLRRTFRVPSHRQQTSSEEKSTRGTQKEAA